MLCFHLFPCFHSDWWDLPQFLWIFRFILKFPSFDSCLKDELTVFFETWNKISEVIHIFLAFLFGECSKIQNIFSHKLYKEIRDGTHTLCYCKPLWRNRRVLETGAQKFIHLSSIRLLLLELSWRMWIVSLFPLHSCSWWEYRAERLTLSVFLLILEKTDYSNPELFMSFLSSFHG